MWLLRWLLRWFLRFLLLWWLIRWCFKVTLHVIPKTTPQVTPQVCCVCDVVDSQVYMDAVLQVSSHGVSVWIMPPCKQSCECSSCGGSWRPTWTEPRPSSAAGRRPGPGRGTSPETRRRPPANPTLDAADRVLPGNSTPWPRSTDLQRDKRLHLLLFIYRV